MINTSIDLSYKTYLFSYSHAGDNWVFEIQANSEADAKARLSKLATAQLEGELLAKVLVKQSLLSNLTVSVLNRLSHIFSRSSDFIA